MHCWSKPTASVSWWIPASATTRRDRASPTGTICTCRSCRTWRTPGHTPGHTSVRISSGGENAVITGDMMHHPIQIAHPDWICEFDTDPKMGSETRKAFVERYCDKPVTVIGTHFAGPTSGHIVRRNG